MKAKAFCSLAVLILLLSTISYSQTTDAPKIKGKACYDLMKEQSECEKSNIVLSLSGGYAVLFRDTGYPNGFNIQADVMYPVSENFALNIGINYTRFPGYHFDYSNVAYTVSDTVYSHIYGDNPITSFVYFTPGVSYGNVSRNSKFNYYVTAGFIVGISRDGRGYYNYTSTFNNSQNKSESVDPSYDFNLGGFVSARISYKVSDKLNVFIEPSAVSNWSDSYFSNYHLNGGISLIL
jgi:hypothetical protein